MSLGASAVLARFASALSARRGNAQTASIDITITRLLAIAVTQIWQITRIQTSDYDGSGPGPNATPPWAQAYLLALVSKTLGSQVHAVGLLILGHDG